MTTRTKLDADFLCVSLGAYRAFQNAPRTEALAYLNAFSPIGEGRFEGFRIIREIVSVSELNGEPITVDELIYVCKSQGWHYTIGGYISLMVTRYGYLRYGEHNTLHIGPVPLPQS